MDQEQARDLLIRIDERVNSILEKMNEGESRFVKIEAVQKTRQCGVNDDRIKKLERATYGSIFGSVLLFMLFVLQWAWRTALGGKP